MVWFSFWVGSAAGVVILALVLALLGKNFLDNNSEEGINK